MLLEASNHYTSDDRALVRLAFAEGLRPQPRVEISQWAERYRILPREVSANAGRWDNRLFPFLTEIMDCLCPWHPAESVTFCKSAQVGGTESGLNWMFAISCMWPGPMLMVHPTIDTAAAYAREKLAPSISSTPEISTLIVEQKSCDVAMGC